MAKSVDYSKRISAPNVMLAADYNPMDVELPVIIQPKLDGVRGLIAPDGKVYYGRSGAPIPNLHYKFGAYDSWIDGEIYLKETPLATISGAIRKQCALTDELTFCAFDLLSNEPQEVRLGVLSLLALSKESPRFILVPSIKAADAEAIYQLYMSTTTEGIIYRNVQAPYIEGRTKYMMKRKRMQTAEYMCVGVAEGMGKFYGTLGAFICVLEDGKTKFNVSAAELTDKERAALWKNPPKGALMTVRFPSKSAYGTPLQAQFVEIRNDT